MAGVTRRGMGYLPTGCLLAILLGCANAQGRAETDQPDLSGGLVEWFPLGNLYSPYTADPRRTGFGLMWATYSDVGIEDSGSPRWHLKLGGSFGILKFHPRNHPKFNVQTNLEAGFSGQFDVENNYDSVGWDGTLGLIFTTSLNEQVGLKFGGMHVSSHVGDEHLERTGRERINYTREEIVAAVSWRFREGWRTYGETGWAYNLDSEDIQDPGRLQTGLEFEAPAVFFGGRGGWYAATDLSAFQETDWQVDAALQGGLVFPRGLQRWRLGLAYYHGRVPINEFFQDNESFATLGLWLDI